MFLRVIAVKNNLGREKYLVSKAVENTLISKAMITIKIDHGITLKVLIPYNTLIFCVFIYLSHFFYFSFFLSPCFKQRKRFFGITYM